MTRSARTPPLALAIALLALALATAALSSPTLAQARVVDGYCSPSGDYCTAIAKRDGKVKWCGPSFGSSLEAGDRGRLQ